jgi:hypothetical protein
VEINDVDVHVHHDGLVGSKRKMRSESKDFWRETKK